MKGITNNKGFGSKGGLNQNQSLKKLHVLNVIKYDTLGRTILSQNIRKRRRKPLMLKILYLS